ncbi:MAG: MFS transporter [Chloroflexi bacterium]|nr:MFS transporter [Chloroflexota bacterium]
MPKKPQSSQKVILLVTCLTSFLTPFTISSINIALPLISAEYQLDAVVMGWVATAYLLSTAVLLVPMGRLGDILGRKRIYLYGVGVFTAASLLCALSTSAAMLLGFRVLQGIGAAMVFGTATAILTSAFPPEQRGRILGINVATVYLGLSLGPFLGGFLTQTFGWRSIFLFNVPIGLINVAAIFWKIKGEWAEARGEKFDFAGSAIYSLALVATIYGLSRLPDISYAWIILAGALAFVFFIAWESRVSSPVINIGLFRYNAVFSLSNLAAFIHYSATFPVSFLLSLYLQYIKALSPWSAGLVLLAMPATQAIFSPVSGRLSDRIEPRILASSGMALSCLGLVFFMFISNQTEMALIIAALIVLGFGFALFSSPNTNAVMSSVEKKFYGIASGTLATMRITGQMFSMAVTLLIFALVIGRTQIVPENYPQFITSSRVVFAVFAGLCVAGTLASLARGNIRSNSRDLEPGRVKQP